MLGILDWDIFPCISVTLDSSYLNMCFMREYRTISDKCKEKDGPKHGLNRQENVSTIDARDLACMLKTFWFARWTASGVIAARV